MAPYLARRLFQSALILIGITLVTFVLLYLVPADPARQIAGRSASAETVASIRRELGLDLPFHQQYWRYLVSLAQGDLGRSYLQRTEVSELIWSRLPASLLLMAGAILCELALGLTMGVVAALRRGRATDQALMVLSFVGVSAPQFVVGILLLYVFAVKLGWFPIGGYGTFAHLVLPSLTLGLLGAGWYARMMRSAMLEVLHQDYVRTAKAKGLPRARVLGKHALRNALIPIVTLLGLSVPALIAGAAITETIFSYPGLGGFFVEAVGNRDYPVVMAFTMVGGLAVILGNLMADVLYGVVDPRIKY